MLLVCMLHSFSLITIPFPRLFYANLHNTPTAMAGADLIPQVIEYLVKKGYVKTEQTLRQESSKVDRDGRPMVDRAEDTGTEQYGKAYRLLSDWIKGGLDIYKASIFSPIEIFANKVLARTPAIIVAYLCVLFP